MSYRDLMTAIASYPDATPDAALRGAIMLARRFGGRLTAVALKAQIRVPHNVVANALIGLEDLAREEEARSARQAKAAAEALLAAAAAAGVAGEALVEAAPPYAEGEHISVRARTHDLCLLPVGPTVLADVSFAEAVLFGSGRPVVVFPELYEASEGDAFAKAVIAWDGSRAASRAVADALPALRSAASVSVLVVTGEKPSARSGVADDLVRHLKAHGIEPTVDEIPARGEPIGRVLSEYVEAKAVDLLVMGGFGRSRALEFILGGATASMLEAPPCPVFLAH